MGDPYDTSAERTSVLGPTLRFKGELHADEELLIRGQIEGSITHSQRITVCGEGIVKANIRAQTIVIEGTVEGDLRGVVSVLIAATATVRGNISAPRVGIMEGANFNGSVDMHSTVGAVRGSDASPRNEFVPPSDIGLTDRSVEKIITK